MANSIEIKGVFFKSIDENITDSEIQDFTNSIIALAEEKGMSFYGILEGFNQ